MSRSPHYSFAFCPSLFVAAAASACFFTSRGACCSQKRKVRPPDKSWAYAAGSPHVSHRPTCVFTAFIRKHLLSHYHTTNSRVVTFIMIYLEQPKPHHISNRRLYASCTLRHNRDRPFACTGRSILHSD